uniref:Uncharacterized protein n=1 Tax=Arion vulgaris TaxID=1028688 RepID=A0A0B6Y889_9EUPU
MTSVVFVFMTNIMHLTTAVLLSHRMDDQINQKATNISTGQLQKYEQIRKCHSVFQNRTPQPHVYKIQVW